MGLLKGRKIYFIAEIGQNHQGSLQIAKMMVDKLVGTDVAAIKTAKRDIDTCLTEEQKKMPYYGPTSFGPTYYEHRKALELSKDDYAELKRYTEEKGFDFISSYTDIPSLHFLKEIGVKILKIASQRVTDTRLLKKTAKLHDGPVIMSSGMSIYKHIDRMIEIFANNEKYLLQCTSVYPCPPELLNLRVLRSFKSRYKKLVDGFGFSGHHCTLAPDIAAYIMGARIIERHFTLDRSWRGGDHAGSIEIDSINQIFRMFEQVKKSLGKKDKKILPEEEPVIKKLRAK